MKKFLFASLFAACAAMGLSSCMNGDYDANPDTQNSTNNPLNPPGSGGGGGGGNATNPSFYSWNGTPPLSAKINGTGFQASSVNALVANGILVIQGMNGTNQIQLSIDNNIASNTAVSATQGVNTVGLMEGLTLFTSSGGSGAGIYIIANDATHMEGKFFGNVKDASGGNSTRDVTEGYFNVTK